MLFAGREAAQIILDYAVWVNAHSDTFPMPLQKRTLIAAGAELADKNCQCLDVSNTKPSPSQMPLPTAIFCIC